MKRIVLLMAFALAATAGAVDATLTWKGPASGGSWDDPANWSTTSTDKTVEEYMTTGVCTYQFSGLADGAVVTNRLAGRKVGGLSIPALKNGRLTFAGAKCALFGPLSWYIGEGTTVDWQIPHPNEWNNNDNGEKICIVGTGTLYLNPQWTAAGVPMDVELPLRRRRLVAFRGRRRQRYGDAQDVSRWTAGTFFHGFYV